MNTQRHDFACTAANGVIYVVGGYGADAEGLSSAEAYNTDSDAWTPIESLRHPRWGCFACGLEGNLYIMGGRSTFSIGNSKYVSLYDPETQSWRERRKCCVMVTAHTALGNKLYCMEWKNQRRLAVFDPLEFSFCSFDRLLQCKVPFGTLNGKLLLLPYGGALSPDSDV